MAKFTVKSDKLTKWQKALINGYSMGEDSKPLRKSNMGKHIYNHKKKEVTWEEVKQYNEGFEEDWEKAKQIIVEEKKKWE